MNDLSQLVVRRNVSTLNRRAGELVADGSAELVAILNTVAAINMNLRRYDAAEALVWKAVTAVAQSSQAETEGYAVRPQQSRDRLPILWRVPGGQPIHLSFERQIDAVNERVIWIHVPGDCQDLQCLSGQPQNQAKLRLNKEKIGVENASL